MQLNKMGRALKSCLSGAVLAMICAGGVAASARADEPEGPTQIEAPQEATPPAEHQQSVGYCSWGYYTCPTNRNIQIDYDVPQCGPVTKPVAQRQCSAQCGRACTDSGWQN